MREPVHGEAFPPEFDIDFLRGAHPVLRLMPEGLVRRWWDRSGRRRGRQATAPALRDAFVALFGDIRPILEIGPFDRPMVRGPGVAYLDVLDRAGLAAKARGNPRRTGEVPPIDYVSPTGDLAIVDRRFRAVCSSHSIEHQPDLVRHLTGVADVLEDGGWYFVLMPDKRYCFDHFGAESTIADVLEAHDQKRTVHGLRTLIESYGLQTHSGARSHWRGRHRTPGNAEATATRVRRAVERHRNAAGTYVDAHAWRFTPDGFRTIVGLLNELGLTPFVPLRVYDTPWGRNEFAAILEKRG